jgi:hypothetical protein
MATDPRSLKIGLSAVAVQANLIESFWANGITQNLVFLALLLQRVRNVAEVFVVPMPDSGEPHHPSEAFGLRQMRLADATRELDVLIEVGVRVPTDAVVPFQAKGGKVVSYVAGNSFVMNLEALASGLSERAEILPPFEFDAVWITRQHWRTNRGYTRIVKSPNTFPVEQIWDSAILRQGMSRVRHNFFYKGRLRGGWSVGIFEPNVNVLKTFHLPVLACERLFRRRPEALHHVFVANTLHLRGNTHFEEFFGALDLQQAQRISAETRFPVFELLGQYVDCVVAHHWENGLNYLYYDVLYGGYPLVHNSEFLRDVGYYYDSFDAESGSNALERALEEHDARRDDYAGACRDVLWRVSPDNPALQSQHAELLEALFA